VLVGWRRMPKGTPFLSLKINSSSQTIVPFSRDLFIEIEVYMQIHSSVFPLRRGRSGFRKSAPPHVPQSASDTTEA